MAKDMRLQIKESVGFEVYHPETNFDQVLNSAGKTLTQVLVDATTAQKGLVQLTDGVTSTSKTTAATPASVKTAYDLANAKASTAVATSSVDGLMAKTDKSKLDGIATGANNYVHPANHPASIITQDSSNRFVTDAEKVAWNAKASTSVATTAVDGLMDNLDKVKLDGIATGANNYTHPANHPASMITGLSTVATSGSYNDLSNKPTIGTAGSKNTGNASGNVPLVGADGKLDASIMPALAITDTFITTSQAAMLALDVQVGDVSVRTDISETFILRAEPASVLSNWQSLLTPTTGVASVAGKTGVVTLTKTDVGLSNVANETRATILASAALTGTPTAPTAAAATNTTQVATTAFVKTDSAAILASAKAYTDTEVTGKVDKVAGKQLSTEDYTSVEKTKLSGIATGANNYVHPANHPASVITQDASNRFVTDAEKATWNAKATTAVATTSADGLMGNTDKTKLDGIATGANNYVHPSNHPASIITQDATNRFVTDAEKTAWNAKASTAVVTTAADGLMAKADKSKLDGIAAGAQANAVTTVAGRTGAVVLTKTDVGLASVDNTTDLAKPISTATQTALNTKAPLASPALTGTPTAPTAAATINNTQVATTAFVKTAVDSVKDFVNTDPTRNFIIGGGTECYYPEEYPQFKTSDDLLKHVGKTVTLSFEIASGYGNGTIVLQTANGNHNIPTTYGFVKHTKTYTLTNAKEQLYFDELRLYIRNVKLEVGDVATDWSPSYEDMKALEVITNPYHGMNIFTNSGAEKVSSNYVSYSGVDMDLIDYRSNDIINRPLVLSFDAKASLPGNAMVSLDTADFSVVVGRTYQRFSAPVQFSDIGDVWVDIHPPTGGTLYVKNVKLEVGSFPTYWTPSPSESAKGSGLRDTVTGKNYSWGIENGLLFVEEV